MTDAELMESMRARVAKCRQLADRITSPTAKRSLLEIAAEGEADIRKMEEAAQGGGPVRKED